MVTDAKHPTKDTLFVAFCVMNLPRHQLNGTIGTDPAATSNIFIQQSNKAAHLKL